jgi:hypothetical protein
VSRAAEAPAVTKARLAFELSLCGGALARPHRLAVGDLEHALPWSTLDVSGLEPHVLERARRRWTELAFNEHRSVILMAQLVQALGEAQVPLDLHSLACAFPMHELAHAEICGRLVSHLGGAADVETTTLETTVTTTAGLSPKQRCHELVVRLCCVGETMSKGFLACMRQRVTHPLMRAVLSRLLRDEALHSGFGWLYLDWCVEEELLEPAELARLATVAREALRPYVAAFSSASGARAASSALAGQRPHDILMMLADEEERGLLARETKQIQDGLSRRGLTAGLAA